MSRHTSLVRIARCWQQPSLPLGESVAPAIGDWRRCQPDLPNRSEVIRRLVERGLETDSSKEHQ
jgi:hypothetical protein